ncbi:MAG: tyrosine-type recombinase/integrase [Acidimicrobiales bacterium]
MRGTMTERPAGSGTWRLRVYVGRDGNGRPIQTSKTVHGIGKRVAEDRLRAFTKSVMASRRPERDATVGRLLERWMVHISAKAAPSTLSVYRYYLDKRILPDLGKVKLAKLDAELLDRTYAKWRKAGLADATIRKHHNILAAALRRGVKWGWLERPPTLDADPPGGSKRLSRVISTAEVQQMIAVCRGGGVAPDGRKRRPDMLLAMAITLAAVTGCRRGELCALRWSDVAKASSTVTVARSVSFVDGELYIGPTKTHQVRRMILDAQTMAVIGGWQAWQVGIAEKVGVPLDDDPYLLSLSPSADRPVLPTTLTQRFRRLMVFLGMPYHLHETRHFAATTMIVAGVNVRQVASRLGHSTPSLTLSTYAHVVDAADEAAASALGSIHPALALAPPLF